MAKASEPKGIVAAKDAFVAVIDGADAIVKRGDLFDADHPLVKKHPNLFGPVTVRSAAPVIEQATAAPGEKRGA